MVINRIMSDDVPRRAEPLWIWGFLLLGGLLIGLPMVTVLWSVGDGQGLHHLWQTVLPEYGRNSILLVMMVTPAVVLLGGVTAWCTSLYTFPGSGWLAWALVLPLALPPYIVAYAYTDFFQSGGLLYQLSGLYFDRLRSLPGAAAILTLVLYPYAYLSARAIFARQASAQVAAARMLGAKGLRLFWRVGLPMGWPALAAGGALAAMESLADYGTVAFFGVPTFTTGIYRAWFGLGEGATAARLSACLLAFIALFLWAERSARGRRSFSEASNAPPLKRSLTGLVGWGMTLWCTAPVVLGFAVPMLLLCVGSLSSPMPGRGDWLPVVGATLMIGVAVAGLGLLLALCFAAARRFARRSPVRAGISMVNFGYAIPGSVVAVGLLIPMTWLDYRLIDLFGGRQLWLTGSIIALVLALQVRFLPLALRPLEAGFSRIPVEMEAAGRSLGAGTGLLFARLHLPLLAPSLGAACLLLFVETVKELPATLILRPFNMDTLAVRAHQLAADERLSQAALPSLVIAFIALLPIILLNRQTAARPRQAALPMPVGAYQ